MVLLDSAFWCDTNFSESDYAEIIDYIFWKLVWYQKKDRRRHACPYDNDSGHCATFRMMQPNYILVAGILSLARELLLEFTSRWPFRCGWQGNILGATEVVSWIWSQNIDLESESETCRNRPYLVPFRYCLCQCKCMFNYNN